MSAMALAKQTIDQLDANGKTVLVRCDFNVPLDGDRITDDRRIVASLPTIKRLLDQGAKVVLCSHLGRPKGGPEPKYSLAPVAKRLSELLGQNVALAPDCVGDEVRAKVNALKSGQVLLLENVRFHTEEEKNDESFAKELASLAEVYVNDAFGTAHRAHASTEGVAHHLPAYAGYLIEKELKFLGDALENPKRPFVAVLGGAKVADKIRVIESLLPKVDRLLIGGGMAYTFLKAQGHEIGKSLLDAESLEFARSIVIEAGDKIVLPTDTVVAAEFKADAVPSVVPVDAIPADQMGLDIGPETQKRFREVLLKAGTVVWNGSVRVRELRARNEGRGGSDVRKRCRDGGGRRR
jgi:phosphoglycerate kinase